MNEQLPPLPYPQLDSVPAFTEPGYTAEQMRDYARAALAMSPKSVSGTSEREAFEAWCRKQVGSADDGMNSLYSAYCWLGWQARAALAANEKVPSRATDIATALSLPGCERLKEWAEIGPVQRAAVEEFAYALADKKNEWRELALKFDGQRMAALSHLRMLLEHGEAHAEAVRKFLAEPPHPAPAPEASIARLVLRDDGKADLEWRSAAPAQAQQAAELATAHEARRYAQSEVAYLKARRSGARLILMRELKEQGWTPPAPAPAQQALTHELQQQCSDWGVYWRAPDAHGVDLSIEQAEELLRRALGVEVAVAKAKPEAQQEAEKLLREAVPHAEWREKRIYGLGPQVYQSWILEVPLLIPAESGMGAGQALDRALGIGASGEKQG